MQENDPLGFFERCFLLGSFHRESFSCFPHKCLSSCYRLGPALGPVTRLSLSPLPEPGSVSLCPVAGIAKDEAFLRPPPEIVDAVEAAVVMLPDVAPLVTRRCRRKETCQLALTGGQRALSRCDQLAALTSYAGDLGEVPASVPTATDGRGVPLDESFLTLVPHERVDLVSLALLSKGARVLHQRGLAAGHWRHSGGGKC